MTRITELVKQKAKAVLAGIFLLIVGVAEWAVNDPHTVGNIAHLIPDPYRQFVPGLLGVVGTWLVHRVPNAQPTSVSFEEPSTATSILKLQQVNGGEFTGTPAH